MKQTTFFFIKNAWIIINLANKLSMCNTKTNFFEKNKNKNKKNHISTDEKEYAQDNQNGHNKV